MALNNQIKANHDAILAEKIERGTAIEQSERKLDETGKLLSERLNQVSTATEAQVAAIKQEEQSRIEGDKTEAQQRQSLAIQLRGDYTGNDLSQLTAGLISAEKQARITGDQAEAKARQSLETRMNGNVSVINKSLEALTSKQQAQTQELSILNSNLKGKADSNSVNELNTRVSDIAGKVTSATSRVQTLSSKLDKVKADLSESVVDLDLSALDESTYYPVILPLTTSRRYYFRVFRTLGQYGDNKPGYATHGSGGFAMIVEWQVSGSGRVTSTVQQVTRLESQVGADSAKIEQTSKVLTDLNGRISASWTMKVQLDSKGNKVITGIGLGFNAQGNSQFLVNAQNFAVISSLNGKVVTPFVIQNGQAFFNDALISQATIDKLLVGDVAVAASYPHVLVQNIHSGRGGWTTATSVITYAGGMPYDMTLVLPSITAIIEDDTGGVHVRLRENCGSVYVWTGSVSRQLLSGQN